MWMCFICWLVNGLWVYGTNLIRQSIFAGCLRAPQSGDVHEEKRCPGYVEYTLKPPPRFHNMTSGAYRGVLYDHVHNPETLLSAHTHTHTHAFPLMWLNKYYIKTIFCATVPGMVPVQPQRASLAPPLEQKEQQWNKPRWRLNFLFTFSTKGDPWKTQIVGMSVPASLIFIKTGQ